MFFSSSSLVSTFTKAKWAHVLLAAHDLWWNEASEWKDTIHLNWSLPLCFCFFCLRGFPPKAGALTVDLEAASRTFDQLLAVPWIKQSVKKIHFSIFFYASSALSFFARDWLSFTNWCMLRYLTALFSTQVNLQVLMDLLVASRTSLKSPEILLLLPLCPLLQEDSSVMNIVLGLAVVFPKLNTKTLETLSKQPQQNITKWDVNYWMWPCKIKMFILSLSWKGDVRDVTTSHIVLTYAK